VSPAQLIALYRATKCDYMFRQIMSYIIRPLVHVKAKLQLQFSFWGQNVHDRP